MRILKLSVDPRLLNNKETVQNSLKYVNKINCEAKLQIQRLYLTPTVVMKEIYTLKFASEKTKQNKTQNKPFLK